MAEILTHTASQLELEYAEKGYVPFDISTVKVYDRVDKCGRCGSVELRHIAMKKEIKDSYKYVAIKHCNHCGNEYTF